MNDRFVINPQTCSGKTGIRGKRFRVKNIPGRIAGGCTADRGVQAHPELTQEDVSAALECASKMVADEQIFAHA